MTPEIERSMTNATELRLAAGFAFHASTRNPVASAIAGARCGVMAADDFRDDMLACLILRYLSANNEIASDWEPGSAKPSRRQSFYFSGRRTLQIPNVLTVQPS